jgi:hypothetical protein
MYMYIYIYSRQIRGAFRDTERTSHLAGLWIGAAISNPSLSNKAGSVTAKRTRLTGKGSKSTAMLSH